MIPLSSVLNYLKYDSMPPVKPTLRPNATAYGSNHRSVRLSSSKILPAEVRNFGLSWAANHTSPYGIMTIDTERQPCSYGSQHRRWVTPLAGLAREC